MKNNRKWENFVLLVAVCLLVSVIVVPMPAFASEAEDENAETLCITDANPVMVFRSVQQGVDWYAGEEEDLPVMVCMPQDPYRIQGLTPLGAVNEYGHFLTFEGFAPIQTPVYIEGEVYQNAPCLAPIYRDSTDDRLYVGVTPRVRVVGGQVLRKGAIGTLQFPSGGDAGLTIYPSTDARTFRAGHISWIYDPITLCPVPPVKKLGILYVTVEPTGESTSTPTVGLYMNDIYTPSDEEVHLHKMQVEAYALQWLNTIHFTKQQQIEKKEE